MEILVTSLKLGRNLVERKVARKIGVDLGVPSFVSQYFGKLIVLTPRGVVYIQLAEGIVYFMGYNGEKFTDTFPELEKVKKAVSSGEAREDILDLIEYLRTSEKNIVIVLDSRGRRYKLIRYSDGRIQVLVEEKITLSEDSILRALNVTAKKLYLLRKQVRRYTAYNDFKVEEGIVWDTLEKTYYAIKGVMNGRKVLVGNVFNNRRRWRDYTIVHREIGVPYKSLSRIHSVANTFLTSTNYW